MHRMERSLLGRQNRVKSKGFVFKHVLANRFTGSGVRPDAEGSRRRIPGLGVGNRIVDGEVELHGLVVHQPEVFDQVQLVAVWVAHPIEPQRGWQCTSAPSGRGSGTIPEVELPLSMTI